jgi:hypothetical protein
LPRFATTFEEMGHEGDTTGTRNGVEEPAHGHRGGSDVEQFSAETLQAERQKFTTAPPVADGPVSPPAAAPAPAPAAPGATTAATATGSFDAAAFYESLRAKLLEAQQVTQMDLGALASSRASTIVASLTGAAGIDAARVKVLEPAQAKRQKRGSSRVASEMDLSGGDSDP